MKKFLILILVLLTFNSYSQKKSNYNSKNVESIPILLGGVSLTFAAVVEGGSQYGTYKPIQNGKNTSSVLVIPPFIAQTPRNIMFGVGVTLTIVGLFSLK